MFMRDYSVDTALFEEFDARLNSKVFRGSEAAGILNAPQEPPSTLLSYSRGLPPVGWDGRSLQSVLKYSKTRVDLSAISDSVMPARLQRHVMAHSPR